MNKWNTIWITGASSGIGYELSKLLSSEASYIAVSARRESKLKELADNYNNIHSHKLDITNEKESRICIEEIEKKSNGSIDLVVLNAGKSSLFKVNDLDSKAIRECFEVNYMGVIHSLGIIIPKMIKAKTGHIAIVSSVAGYRGLPNSIAYGPTKAALINLVLSIGLILVILDRKKSKAFDMNIYWIRDRIRQGRFFLFWDKGKNNKAGYFPKHFPPEHHKEIRYAYLHPPTNIK